MSLTIVYLKINVNSASESLVQREDKAMKSRLKMKIDLIIVFLLLF